MIDFSCFRNVQVCLSPEPSPISFPRIILSPHSVMTLYPSFCTIRIVIGGEFSNSLLLLPISSVEYFSSSGLKVKSFVGMCSPPSVSGNYIINLLTPAPLFLVLRFISSLALSLIFMLQ